jgi:hypothetical protein
MGWRKEEVLRRVDHKPQRDLQEMLDRIWRQRCSTMEHAESQKVRQAAQTTGLPIEAVVQVWELCDGDWNQILAALGRLRSFA